MPEGQRGDAPQTMPVLTKKRKIVLTNTDTDELLNPSEQVDASWLADFDRASEEL